MSLTILVKQDHPIMDILKSMLAKGRPVNLVKASHIEDLVSLQKAVVLCAACYKSGWFDWKQKGYYSIWDYEQTPVDGHCDACKEYGTDRRLYLHESIARQSWLMKDQSRRRA